jgi:hypothetical protein
MNRDELLKKIKVKAKHDARKRQDPRFKRTMGFLVAKGFLQTNFEVQKLPNQRLLIEDAIWAGKNVEPRILEVLPAAVLRLEKHFDLNAEKHKGLARVVNQLREGIVEGDEFFEIPFKKLKAWVNLPLPDGRTKVQSEKKLMKTFRLSPKAVATLEQAALRAGRSITEVLEERIFLISK